MVLELSPSEIRYSQNSMRSRFRNGNPIKETLRKLLSGKITVVDIPRIRVAKKDGKYYSMDNRRLYVFKRFEEKKGTKIKVKCIETGMDPGKFTTTNDGTSIRINKCPPMAQLQEIGRALRCIGDELDGDQKLQELISRVEPEDSHTTFLRVAKYIVSVSFSWDTVVKLFFFAYKMAIKALDKIPLIRAIINWVINFIVEHLADWILSRGGWEAIVEYFGTPKRQAFGVLIAGVIISAGIYVWKTM